MPKIYIPTRSLAIPSTAPPEKSRIGCNRAGWTCKPDLPTPASRHQLGSAAPSVCLIGELDGIRSPEHPLAVSKTGMSHACGHHVRLTALAGAALALSQPEVASALTGRAVFFAVPCEEHVPMNRLEQLRSDGIATCCGGKPELLLRGAFDDINAAITTHAHMVPCQSDFLLGCNCDQRIFVQAAFTSRAEPLTRPLRRKTASMRWTSCSASPAKRHWHAAQHLPRPRLYSHRRNCSHGRLCHQCRAARGHCRFAGARKNVGRLADGQ